MEKYFLSFLFGKQNFYSFLHSSPERKQANVTASWLSFLARKPT
jgi:hypothetical protein